MTEIGELRRTGSTFEVLLPDGPLEARIERLEAMTRALLEKNAQLERALRSRVVIEQAKGKLAERLGVGVDQAFEVLRFSARSSQLKLQDLAGAVVTSRETPPAVKRWLARERA